MMMKSLSKYKKTSKPLVAFTAIIALILLFSPLINYWPQRLVAGVASALDYSIKYITSTKAGLIEELVLQEQANDKLKSELLRAKLALEQGIDDNLLSLEQAVYGRIHYLDLREHSLIAQLDSGEGLTVQPGDIVTQYGVYLGQVSFVVGRMASVSLPKRGETLEVVVPALGSVIAEVNSSGSYQIDIPRDLPVPAAILLASNPDVIVGEVVLTEAATSISSTIHIVRPVTPRIHERVYFLDNNHQE